MQLNEHQRVRRGQAERAATRIMKRSIAPAWGTTNGALATDAKLLRPRCGGCATVPMEAQATVAGRFNTENCKTPP
eukprot:6369463-Alexandrium_andersonii.AAC.1